jgi:hypothetical protein
MLAAVLHQALPEDEPIDLINVSFSSKTSSVEYENGCNGSDLPYTNLVTELDNLLNLNNQPDQIKKLEIDYKSKQSDSNKDHGKKLLNNFSNCMQSEESPDRLASIAALGELTALYPNRNWRLVFVDVPSNERSFHEDYIKYLIQVS